MTWTPPAPALGDGPPRNVLPAFAGPHALLIDTGDFAAGVGGLQIYPSGITFTLAVRTTRPNLELSFGGPPMPASEPCHLYIELPDGESVTGDYLTPSDTPRGLRHTGGSGGGGAWDMHWWTWPQPAPGILRVRMDCPTLNLSGDGSINIGDLDTIAGHTRTL